MSLFSSSSREFPLRSRARRKGLGGRRCSVDCLASAIDSAFLRDRPPAPLPAPVPPKPRRAKSTEDLSMITRKSRSKSEPLPLDTDYATISCRPRLRAASKAFGPTLVEDEPLGEENEPAEPDSEGYATCSDCSSRDLTHSSSLASSYSQLPACSSNVSLIERRQIMHQLPSGHYAEFQGIKQPPGHPHGECGQTTLEEEYVDIPSPVSTSAPKPLFPIRNSRSEPLGLSQDDTYTMWPANTRSSKAGSGLSDGDAEGEYVECRPYNARSSAGSRDQSHMSPMSPPIPIRKAGQEKASPSTGCQKGTKGLSKQVSEPVKAHSKRKGHEKRRSVFSNMRRMFGSIA